MPILDLLGSSSMDVHEAIFDIDLHGELGLFDESDGEDEGEGEDWPTMAVPTSAPAARSGVEASRSHDSLRQRQRSPLRPSGMVTPPENVRRTTSLSLSPRKSQRTRTRSAVSPSGAASPSGSPRLRPTGLPAIVPSNSTEVPTIGPRSPLGALFGARRERAVSMAGVEASVKRVEAVVDEVKRMPVNRLKDEMKELQVRGRNGLGALLRVADADRRWHCFLAGPTSEDRELAVDADTGNEERHWTPFDDPPRFNVTTHYPPRYGFTSTCHFVPQHRTSYLLLIRTVTSVLDSCFLQVFYTHGPLPLVVMQTSDPQALKPKASSTMSKGSAPLSRSPHCTR